MGTAWGAAAAALALLALGFSGTASAEGDDCIEVYVPITQEWGQHVRVCPGGGSGAEPEGGPGGVPLELPGLPTPQPNGAPLEHYRCPAGSYGREFILSGTYYYVCTNLDWRLPTVGSLTGDGGGGPASPGDGGADLEPCSQPGRGYKLHVRDWTVGACAFFEYRMPDMEEGGGIFIDATGCSIPEGPGVDPGVHIFGGGVAFCVVPMLVIGSIGDPGPVPGEELPIEVVTEPCSTRGTDPGVRIGDGHVLVCLEVGWHPA